MRPAENIRTRRGCAAILLGLLLLALVAQPVVAMGVLLGLVLAPVLLFGLVAVPWSLSPVAEFRPVGVPTVFVGSGRFQRPPPLSLL